MEPFNFKLNNDVQGKTFMALPDQDKLKIPAYENILKDAAEIKVPIILNSSLQSKVSLDIAIPKTGTDNPKLFKLDINTLNSFPQVKQPF
jgi:hypothetical protein